MWKWTREKRRYIFNQYEGKNGLSTYHPSPPFPSTPYKWKPFHRIKDLEPESTVEADPFILYRKKLGSKRVKGFAQNYIRSKWQHQDLNLALLTLQRGLPWRQWHNGKYFVFRKLSSNSDTVTCSLFYEVQTPHLIGGNWDQESQKDLAKVPQGVTSLTVPRFTYL